jgi:hypothetical protein
MKKIFLVAGILLTTTAVTFAQNNNDAKQVKMEGSDTKKELRKEHRSEGRNDVNYFTRNYFANDFPGAKNVRFETTNAFDEVSFLSGKKNLTAYYDSRNQLVGTTQNKSFADLPGKAQKEILKKYGDYTIAGIIRYDDNDDNDVDMVLHGISFADMDNYFVALKKDDKEIVVEVDVAGYVSYFAEM